MKQVTLYTDGGCRGNGKKSNIGAIGGILIHPKSGSKKEYFKAYPGTTNNRMEILSIIQGLKQLKEPCEVQVYSDSAYVVNAINKGWLRNWKRKNWVRKDNPLKNVDLWKELDQLLKIHKVTFNKVQGHADNEYNNRADYLVNRAMDEYLER